MRVKPARRYAANIIQGAFHKWLYDKGEYINYLNLKERGYVEGLTKKAAWERAFNHYRHDFEVEYLLPRKWRFLNKSLIVFDETGVRVDPGVGPFGTKRGVLFTGRKAKLELARKLYAEEHGLASQATE